MVDYKHISEEIEEEKGHGHIQYRNEEQQLRIDQIDFKDNQESNESFTRSMDVKEKIIVKREKLDADYLMKANQYCIENIGLPVVED